MTPAPPAPAATAAALHRLAATLEQENAALAALDFGAVGGLLPEKEAALAALAASPPPSPALTAQVRALAGLVQRNRDLLDRAITTQRHIIALVARASPPEAPPTYHAPGGRQAMLRPPARTLCARA
ncbi:MAG: hypothetical protein KGL52_15420 [Rhodospirillales bacterium]|jgi:hypothetical protein|nr:hypothetical protein [Rhodospirillales bacterium]